jgi:hypothetical protein
VDDRKHAGAIEKAPRIAGGFAVEEELNPAQAGSSCKNLILQVNRLLFKLLSIVFQLTRPD